MGGCLSGIAGHTNGDNNNSDFRNLNDSRHVMLLLAKKERKREPTLRRSISLGNSMHSKGQRDTSSSSPSPPKMSEKKTAASISATKKVVQIPTAERSSSDHTVATATTTSNNNSQRRVASLQRSDSSNRNRRSRRSLTMMTAKSHRNRKGVVQAGLLRGIHPASITTIMLDDGWRGM